MTKYDSIVQNGRTYLRCQDCGRFGREGWPHDCRSSSSWFSSIVEVERQNTVVSAAKITDLAPDASRGAVEECVARLAEVLAVWPASMRTAGFIVETRELASRHLTSIGVEDGPELVEAAIMKALALSSLASAREEIIATRERAQEERDRQALEGDARRGWLIKLAADMRRNGAGYDEMLSAIGAGNDRRCQPPLPEKDVVVIAETIAKYDPTAVPNARKITSDFRSAKKGEPASEDELEKRLNFQVEKIVAIDSDPPIYYLTIAGPPGTVTKEYSFSTEDLLTMLQFKKRFSKGKTRLPLGLPKSTDEWEALVDRWLERATTIAQPDDASPLAFMKDHIQYGLLGLGQGQTTEDLDAGKMLRKDGRMVIKAKTALKIARELDNRIEIQVVCDHLRRIGFENKTVWFSKVEGAASDREAVKAWIGPEAFGATAPSGAESPASPAAAPGSNGNGHAEPQPTIPYDDAPIPTDPDMDDPEDLPL